MVALLKHQDRLAEAYEILELLARTAREKDDIAGLRRFSWEQSWILERWGQPAFPDIALPMLSEPKQLSLAFPD